MKKLKKGFALFALICTLCVAYKSPVYASMADDAENYYLQTTFEGHMEGYEGRYYKFTINNRSYVSLQTTCKVDGSNKLTFQIYSEEGKVVLKRKDVIEKYNVTTNTYKGNNGRILDAGTYYLYIKTGDDKTTWYAKADFLFRIQSENIITLSRGSISSIKYNKNGTINIKYNSDPNATGYRIQYSTNEKFANVKTIYTSDTLQTISGLKKGKIYFFKVCPYAVYDDGKKVYGNNSKVKSIKIK